MMSNPGLLPIKKKAAKSLFRRVSDWLHLWLGLSSGLVIFIVSMTGCLYVFEKDIREFTEPWQHVEEQPRPYLLPTRLAGIARQHAFGNLPDTGEHRIRSIQYGEPGRAAVAAYNTKETGYVLVYLNPYTGAVLRDKVLKQDFFRIVLEGHFYLWLPHKTGKLVVASSVLVFVLLLISGLIMWWPKNLKKANVDKSFKIKWKARFRRLNYDLHNVLGFYVMLGGLVLALTGLVWGFEWFRDSVYWVSSGGKSFPGKEQQKSMLPSVQPADTQPPADRLWQKLRPEGRNSKGTIRIQFPQKVDDVFVVDQNPELKTYYRREFSRYDQYSLDPLPLRGVFAESFEEASVADKLNRMNYDIHVGAIGGMTGKLLAFFISFICGSLPVTGFFIWRGRRMKGKITVVQSQSSEFRRPAVSGQKTARPAPLEV